MVHYCRSSQWGSCVVILALVLGLCLSATSPAEADNEREVKCLALTIYHEARGESELGQLSVGHVVMNRARDPRFPSDVCEVVREGGEVRNRCQFSWFCDGRSDRPRDREALRESLRLARLIYDGCTLDPTRGALWYHAAQLKLGWAKRFGLAQRIGGHKFYRGGNAPRRLDIFQETTQIAVLRQRGGA